MLRAVLAAIAGYVGIGVLVVFTDELFSLLVNGFNAKATPPPYYFLITAFTDSLYSILGGYLCATIARRSADAATLILMVGGEVAGVMAAILSWRTVPHWFAFALLVLYPPAVWVGSRLVRQSETASPET